MNDAIVVQMPYSQPYLVRKLLDPALSQLELACLDVVKQVATLHVLQHNVVVFTILKQVNETDNIWVLAHLEHLDLSPLLIYLYLLHIFLVDCLDCHLLAIVLVRRQFHEAKLAFAEIALEVIEIKHIVVTDRVLELLGPLLLQCFVLEVEESAFVRWQYNLHWIKQARLTLTHLSRHLLHKSSDERVHDLVGLAPLEILLVLVAVNLVPGNDGTVLLVSVCFGFEQTETLEDNIDLGVVLIISEPLKWPRLRRVLLLIVLRKVALLGFKAFLRTLIQKNDLTAFLEAVRITAKPYLCRTRIALGSQRSIGFQIAALVHAEAIRILVHRVAHRRH